MSNKTIYLIFNLRYDSRFQHASTACSCVFKEITLVWANQGTYFKNETACSKRTLKTTVATQLKRLMINKTIYLILNDKWATKRSILS